MSVIIKPIVTEKMTQNSEKFNRFGFQVRPEANKLEIKAAVEKAVNEILVGKGVFSGVIYENEGNLRCKENQVIRDELLLEQFDWYVEGVEFYEE